MTKLEELSELLVSEIEQFQKTVEKLQKIQEQKILRQYCFLLKLIHIQPQIHLQEPQIRRFPN